MPVYDLAIAGSGFAGSLLSMIAKRIGLTVVLIESGRHPRFAIGESSTPLANLLLEELATRYRLPKVAALAKWGTWQQQHPDLPCGLKRGFSFFHHTLGGGSSSPGKELLVAASPHDRVADTHWYRSEFDHFLVRCAQEEGVEFLDQTQISKVTEAGEEVRLECAGSETPIRARFLVDATGPRGLLHKTLQLKEASLSGFPATQVLYTHVTGAHDLKHRDFGHVPAFPVNDAALHHVFDGGWIWVLRFNNGIASIGVAATEEVARRFRFEEGECAWHRLLQELPAVREQLADARPTRAFTYAKNVAFRSATIAGPRWALLPSAAGFVDPLLSTGFPLTLLGIERLANLFENDWGTPRFAPQLENYAQRTDQELLATARLIAALYANMQDFDRFTELSLLYFAAASYSEAARRLGRSHLASSFLLHDHPNFGPAARHLLENAHQPDLKLRIRQAIKPIDIAGLSREDRHKCYPVDAEDLLAAAGKLESTRSEIHAVLARSGFWNAHA